jgi:transcriptional regulator with XRE-family HTH domain
MNRKPRSLGSAVRAARRQRDMTQDELAAFAGVVPTYVTAIECNRRSGVSVEKLHLVATALGCQLELVDANEAVVPIRLSRKTLALLDRLERTGLHGIGREHVAENLLYNALQAALGEGGAA